MVPKYPRVQSVSRSRRKLYRLTTLHCHLLTDLLEREYTTNRYRTRSINGWLMSDIRATLLIISPPRRSKRIPNQTKANARV